MSEDLKIEMPAESRECGRPAKRTGLPCRRNAERFAAACTQHMTAEESSRLVLVKAVWAQAYEHGYRTSEERHLDEIQALKVKNQKLSASLHIQSLRFEQDGNQIVNVGGLPYLWSGSEDPLVVGEEVMIPCSPSDYALGKSGLKKGVVTSLGTTLRVPIGWVRGRAEP